MRYPVLVALFVVASLVASAAESKSNAKVQSGKLATVHLLATARVSGKAVPDGVRFLVLVKRNPEVAGDFTLKETRDFRVAGQSYQEKTEAELGKKFEPGTSFDTAEGFFSKQPGLRRMAPDDIKDAYVLTIAIGGAQLTPGEKAEVTVHPGFDKQVESFTFRFTVPPIPGQAPKS